MLILTKFGTSLLTGSLLFVQAEENWVILHSSSRLIREIKHFRSPFPDWRVAEQKNPNRDISRDLIRKDDYWRICYKTSSSIIDIFDKIS